MNNKWSINKVASYLILTISLGTLIAGCGGGGDTGTVSGGVASYLADQQGGSFLGRWWYAASGAASAVKADENTLLATGTSQYAGTAVHKILSGSSWIANPNPDIYYDLSSPLSGWVTSPDTVTLVDNGDGRNVTITPTGEPAFVAAVTKTNLANTSITCADSTGATITCPGTSVYPVGAASYRLTVSYSSTQYELYGDTLAKKITNQAGAVLIALPALDTTFCDPTFPYVFEAQGSGIYKVWPTADCSAGAIATAITAPTADGTVVMDRPGTNNTYVPYVLHVQSVTTIGNTLVSGMRNMIYGERLNAVWYGWMLPIGTYQLDPEFNKTALNAQLLANGQVSLP